MRDLLALARAYGINFGEDADNLPAELPLEEDYPDPRILPMPGSPPYPPRRLPMPQQPEPLPVAVRPGNTQFAGYDLMGRPVYR